LRGILIDQTNEVVIHGNSEVIEQLYEFLNKNGETSEWYQKNIFQDEIDYELALVKCRIHFEGFSFQKTSANWIEEIIKEPVTI
jgi:hypothetical protein